MSSPKDMEFDEQPVVEFDEQPVHDVPGPAMAWDVKAPANDVNPVAATAAAGLQGLSLNTLDDLAGLIGGKDAKAKARAFLQASNRAAPIAAPIAQGAGNIATGIGTTAALGPAALIGTGAVQGFGGAADDEKLSGAVLGTLSGAVPAAAGKAGVLAAQAAPKLASTLGFASHEAAKNLGRALGAGAGASIGGALGGTTGALTGALGGAVGGSAMKSAILGKQVPRVAEDGFTSVGVGAKAPEMMWTGGLYGKTKEALQNAPKVLESPTVKKVATFLGSTASSLGNAIGNALVGDRKNYEGTLASSAEHSRQMAVNMAYRKKFAKKMNKESE